MLGNYQYNQEFTVIYKGFICLDICDGCFSFATQKGKSAKGLPGPSGNLNLMIVFTVVKGFATNISKDVCSRPLIENRRLHPKLFPPAALDHNVFCSQDVKIPF